MLFEQRKTLYKTPQYSAFIISKRGKWTFNANNGSLKSPIKEQIASIIWHLFPFRKCTKGVNKTGLLFWRTKNYTIHNDKIKRTDPERRSRLNWSSEFFLQILWFNTRNKKDKKAKKRSPQKIFVSAPKVRKVRSPSCKFWQFRRELYAFLKWGEIELLLYPFGMVFKFAPECGVSWYTTKVNLEVQNLAC